MSPTVRVLIIWVVPLLLFMGTWVYLMLRSNKLSKRSFAHMDALEAKVDRIIQLIEERFPPR